MRAKRPALVRRAPSPEDTRAVLKFIAGHASADVSLACDLLYGCGGRVSEPLNLRVRDVDVKHCKFVFRHAKQQKDRVVAIPCSALVQVEQQLQYARNLWEREGQRWPVKLPGRLRFKYPKAEFSWEWFWLFPARGVCRDKRDGGRIVRWRLHQSNVERAVRRACVALGLSILPHELRHGYATDCLNRGANPRAVQQAMGHKSLETTMGYIHAEALSVASPLDVVAG